MILEIIKYFPHTARHGSTTPFVYWASLCVALSREGFQESPIKLELADLALSVFTGKVDSLTVLKRLLF